MIQKKQKQVSMDILLGNMNVIVYMSHIWYESPYTFKSRMDSIAVYELTQLFNSIKPDDITQMTCTALNSRKLTKPQGEGWKSIVFDIELTVEITKGKNPKWTLRVHEKSVVVYGTQPYAGLKNGLKLLLKQTLQRQLGLHE